MKRPLIAIDPGASGGLAWMDADGITHAEPMPTGMTAQADRLRALAAELPGAEVVIEKVGTYMYNFVNASVFTIASNSSSFNSSMNSSTS